MICHSKLKHIKVLLLDVDGVLTKGDIMYHNDKTETKAFNVKDGFGIRLLLDSGINVGIITARKSDALLHRCADLGIQMIYDGVTDKGNVLESVLSKTGLSPKEIAFVGDDLPDIPLLKKVGASIAVADAHETVRSIVDMVTVREGGNGAVREVCDWILQAKGHWEDIILKWE
jgi:3-deoxy-D-manno-octulosonate 8-phosphate phosphatase (KDO 8-P phosphatase)